jgi:hypothetical protein
MRARADTIAHHPIWIDFDLVWSRKRNWRGYQPRVKSVASFGDVSIPSMHLGKYWLWFANRFDGRKCNAPSADDFDCDLPIFANHRCRESRAASIGVRVADDAI